MARLCTTVFVDAKGKMTNRQGKPVEAKGIHPSAVFYSPTVRPGDPAPKAQAKPAKASKPVKAKK